MVIFNWLKVSVQMVTGLWYLNRNLMILMVKKIWKKVLKNTCLFSKFISNSIKKPKSQKNKNKRYLLMHLIN